MPTPTTPTDDRVVSIPRVEPAPVEKPAADDFDTRYRERLKADYGVDDPEELKRAKERAARADELEREFESLRAQAPPAAPRMPAPRPTPGAPLDFERLREYGRIDPMGAYVQYDQYREAQRQQAEIAREQRMLGAITAAQQYQAESQHAQSYLKDEFPEVFDGRSALQREAVAVYNSHPYYQSRGLGMREAAEIAAARLGILPKSKRTAPAPAVERDAADQNVERGTRKPPRDRDDSDDKPLTAAEKKMAAKMGLDEKKFRVARKARREQKDVRVD